MQLSKNSRALGFTAGILAAVFYGTNPLGTLPLLHDGISAPCIVFYRYGLAALMFAVCLAVRRESLRIKWGYAIKLAILGVLFALSSLTLYESFNYMDAGVASTILFSYPIMTALLMVMFYHERITWRTTIALVLAIAGIALLYHGDGHEKLSGIGMVLVLMSSLLYALYIVYVNQFHVEMSAMKFTFWVIFFGWLTIGLFMLVKHDPPQLLHGPTQWLWAFQLALMPTVLSIFLINVAIMHIGSTPTAIMGALEPLTAVLISCTLFGETFTGRLAVGIVLILSAVTVIILQKQPAKA